MNSHSFPEHNNSSSMNCVSKGLTFCKIMKPISFLKNFFNGICNNMSCQIHFCTQLVLESLSILVVSMHKVHTFINLHIYIYIYLHNTNKRGKCLSCLSVLQILRDRIFTLFFFIYFFCQNFF